MASFWFMHFVLFFLLAPSFLVSSSTISYKAFESHRMTGRHLLQQKHACPVNFENENYTIITSQCKGPEYKRDPCCHAFLEIACPHYDKLNDEKNNCASTLFSYINLYGKYPPGLFASMCKGDKEGLSCDEFFENEKNSHNSGAEAISSQLSLLMLIVGLVVFVFDLF